MTIHLNAQPGQIAEHVLMPGDPLRAKYIADTFVNRIAFPNINYAPHASFKLLDSAYQISKENKEMRVHVGSVYTADIFYSDDLSIINKFASYGVLGVEMETAALYTLGAKYGIDVLSIMTASDHVLTGEKTTPEERQSTFNDMIIIALNTLTRQSKQSSI